MKKSEITYNFSGQPSKNLNFLKGTLLNLPKNQCMYCTAMASCLGNARCGSNLCPHDICSIIPTFYLPERSFMHLTVSF